MLEQKLLLNRLDDVKAFVRIAETMDYKIELISDKYIADAKSIMGVFSLDLTKPVVMRAYCENNGELLKQIFPFVYGRQNRKRRI